MADSVLHAPIGEGAGRPKRDARVFPAWPCFAMERALSRNADASIGWFGFRACVREYASPFPRRTCSHRERDGAARVIVDRVSKLIARAPSPLIRDRVT
jgi:hypothetical protein